MGYESRIKIMTKPNEVNWSEDLCTMNLCCMGDFREIFKDEVTFRVYFNELDDVCLYDGLPESFNPTKEDLYGEKLKYTSIDNVIEYLTTHGIAYRRSYILLQTLLAYKNSFEEDLIVVHFGY